MQNKLAEQALRSLARTAFAIHYEATKKPGWRSAEDHWKDPGCQALWVGIVSQTILGARLQESILRAGAGAPAPASHALAMPRTGVNRPTAPPDGFTPPPAAGVSLVADLVTAEIHRVATAPQGDTNGGENLAQGRTPDVLTSDPDIKVH